VLPFPAPLNVAVSPVPGTGEALQFASPQMESVLPVQVPLAAFKLKTPANQSRLIMENVLCGFIKLVYSNLNSVSRIIFLSGY
jgi:hypothetical protein